MSLNDILSAHDMTKASFSRRFGIPYRTVQDWADGKRKPPEYVIRMAEELIKIRKEDG